jgi:pimeloyl-ACP methyl ester carboxylesterase
MPTLSPSAEPHADAKGKNMTTSAGPTVAERAPGAAFTEGTVTVQDFTVRYFQAGEGEPLAVLHGAGGPRLTLALDLLARQHRVVLLEMPGFGDQANDVHTTPAELAEAAAEAFAAIGIDRYHVLGTSFGGGIALHLALTHPDRVISLVLEAPAAFREGATSPADIPPEDMVRRFRVHPERVPAFTPPDPAVMARTWPLVERLLASRPEFDSELADRLPEVSIRTLVLFGDRDGIVPAENGRTYRRLMPNCSYVLVHDAAHDIQGDRPEAFADVAGDFLARGWQFLLPEQSTLINP